ncbi:MAG: hypothetical protein HY370_07500 [Proteobacteria bacterium]|nr:hypothetical protein [Pseudomonadota bacterium]
MNKDRETILTAYGLFAAMMAASFIPAAWAVMTATILYFIALAYPYYARKRAAAGGLTENHMTYIIRTIWIASLVAVATVAAGVCYVLALYDPSSINECTQNLMNGGMNAEACIADFMNANRSVLYSGGFIAVGPIAFYCLWRLFRGARKALNMLPLQNVNAWL